MWFRNVKNITNEFEIYEVHYLLNHTCIIIMAYLFSNNFHCNNTREKMYTALMGAAPPLSEMLFLHHSLDRMAVILVLL